MTGTYSIISLFKEKVVKAQGCLNCV